MARPSIDKSRRFHNLRVTLSPELEEKVTSYYQAMLAAGIDMGPTDIVRELIAIGLSSSPMDAAVVAVKLAAFSQHQHWLFSRTREWVQKLEGELRRMEEVLKYG